MHIRDIFASDQTTVSFEFFPPKTAVDAQVLYENIARLEALQPSFVSVTYGAGGSTRELTHDLVIRLKQTTTLDPIPHLTCVCHGELAIEEILTKYAQAGVSNTLALGGDPLRELVNYDRTADAFQSQHARSQPLRGSSSGRNSGGSRFPTTPSYRPERIRGGYNRE
jgi:methylenetetrahydrofolate reductase (NADPH)